MDPSGVKTDDQMMQMILKFYPVLKNHRGCINAKRNLQTCWTATFCNERSSSNSIRQSIGQSYASACCSKIFQEKIGAQGYQLMRQAMNNF